MTAPDEILPLVNDYRSKRSAELKARDTYEKARTALIVASDAMTAASRARQASFALVVQWVRGEEL